MAINWDELPMQPVKTAAAFLGVTPNRLRGWLKNPEKLPADAPMIEVVKEDKRYYIMTESLHLFKIYMEEHPEISARGGTREAGVRKYFIYLGAEQATEIRNLVGPKVRFELANKPKPKAEAEVGEDAAPTAVDELDELIS